MTDTADGAATLAATDDDGREPPVRPVAVVTGAARGIGAATALALAEAGWDLVLGDVAAPDAAAALVETCSGTLDLGATPSDVGPGRSVACVPTATLLVSRGALRSAGGFDETMPVGEDVDLVWRLGDVRRVRYEPDVVCLHRQRTTVGTVLRRRFDYGTSAAALERRHAGSSRHADVSVWSLVPWLLGVLVHPATGALPAAATVAIAPRGLRPLPAAVRGGSLRTARCCPRRRSVATSSARCGPPRSWPGRSRPGDAERSRSPSPPAPPASCAGGSSWTGSMP